MKRGQQTGGTAAGLVATIAGLIVLYILFLPAEERAELLGEDVPQTSSKPSVIHPQTIVDRNETIFVTSPGEIHYQKLDEFEYDLPAFTLLKTTEAQVIETLNNFRIRNGWFDKITKNVSFETRDLENMDNVLLSFNAQRHRGTLTIKLNGAGIYEFDIDTPSPEPVTLHTRRLNEGINVLEFSVSGVGLRFWTTNEYSFSDMKIVADITDVSRQESRNTFYISPEEGENGEKAVLKFNPDCDTREVGVLEVDINGRNVFTGIPDCGILNTYTVSPSLLNVGKNSVTFKTERGSYLIDQIHVKTFLKEPVQPTFYFELEDDLFTPEEKAERCGDIDDVCPDDCSEDLDFDCCFEEYPEGFWCDVRTDFLGDRCVGFVDKGECDRCPAGYEDQDGDPPEECENICGDDTDDECPDDCAAKYDKDCCFELHGDQFWCDDLPITGADFTCMHELSRSTCQNCPTEYEAEEDDFDCEFAEGEEEELKRDIDIVLIFRFTESREEKEAEIWINGKQTSFATRESSYRKNIDDLVEPGTNSIRIRPRTDLDIRELEVKLD